MRLPVVILLLFVATLPLTTTTTTTTTTATTRRRHQTERRIRTHINRGRKTDQLKREEEEEMEKTARTQMIREEEEEEDRRKGEEEDEKQEQEVEVVVTRLKEEKKEKEEEEKQEEIKRRRRIRGHINTDKEEEKQEEEEEEIALVSLKEEKEEEEEEEEEENQEERKRKITRRHTNRDREKEDGKRAKRQREEEKKKKKEEEEEEVAVVSLKVPQYVPKGHDAELECLWRVPRLYSVKWYHNDRELYGYKPSEAPTTTLYPLPGVRVDRARSTGSLLVLAGVGVGAAGRYKCEVIGEAPGFLTADRSAVMRVVHIPKEPPSIQGTQPQYRVGQRVHLSCVSPPARPPASLTWYINDRQASPEYVSGLNTTTIWGDGLLETHAGLALTLQPSHFDARGQLRFRCAASIPGLYHKVRQHTIGAPPPLPPSLSPPLSPSSPSSYNVKAPVMESRDSAAAAAASCATSVSAYGGGGISRSAVLLPLLSLLTLLLSFSLS